MRKSSLEVACLLVNSGVDVIVVVTLSDRANGM